MAETAPKQEVVVHEPDAPETSSGALMRLIEKATLQPDFDVAKLEKLLDVKAKWEANEARKAFVEAKTNFRAEAPNILKNKHVGFTSRRTGGDTDYDYATLDHVADILSPLLAKHGLSYSWETEQRDDAAICVTCILSHTLGHSERVTLRAMPDTSGNKNNIQAIGSTVSFLERYTLLAATGIATKQQDDDGARGGTELITDEQAEELMLLVTEVKADPNKFLAYLGVDAFTSIPAKEFQNAKAALEKKRGAKP